MLCFTSPRRIFTKKGYKGTSEIIHQAVNEALIVLAQEDLTSHIMVEYEEERQRASQITGQTLSEYGAERRKRSEFQYETTEAAKKAKAQTSFERAIKFVDIMSEILLKMK